MHSFLKRYRCETSSRNSQPLITVTGLCRQHDYAECMFDSGDWTVVVARHAV